MFFFFTNHSLKFKHQPYHLKVNRLTNYSVNTYLLRHTVSLLHQSRKKFQNSTLWNLWVLKNEWFQYKYQLCWHKSKENKCLDYLFNKWSYYLTRCLTYNILCEFIVRYFYNKNHFWLLQNPQCNVQLLASDWCDVWLVWHLTWLGFVVLVMKLILGQPIS